MYTSWIQPQGKDKSGSLDQEAPGQRQQTWGARVSAFPTVFHVSYCHLELCSSGFIYWYITRLSTGHKLRKEGNLVWPVQLCISSSNAQVCIEHLLAHSKCSIHTWWMNEKRHLCSTELPTLPLIFVIPLGFAQSRGVRKQFRRFSWKMESRRKPKLRIMAKTRAIH